MHNARLVWKDGKIRNFNKHKLTIYKNQNLTLTNTISLLYTNNLLTGKVKSCNFAQIIFNTLYSLIIQYYFITNGKRDFIKPCIIKVFKVKK